MALSSSGILLRSGAIGGDRPQPPTPLNPSSRIRFLARYARFGYQLKPGQWSADRPTAPLVLSRFQR